MDLKVSDSIMDNLKDLYPLFDAIKNGITITDENSKILYVNPAFTKITGYLKDEVIGESPGMLRSGCHNKSFYKLMWDSIKIKGFWEGEIWNRQKSGKLYPSLLTITRLKNVDNGRSSYIAIFSDVSFLKSDSTKKMNLAFYDPLTKLPNRFALKNEFDKYIATYERKYYQKTTELVNRDKILILFFDLNGFKLVNDNYGHVIGDELLIEVANRLKNEMRETDTIARFGGDEFIGIIPDVMAGHNIEEYCSRILKVFASPFKLEGEIELNVTTSLGVSIYPDDGSGLYDLIKKADQAMYLAKKSGKSCCIYKQDCA